MWDPNLSEGLRMGSVEQILKDYSHCPICEAHMHFIHMTDFSMNLTQESARCPECGTQTRSVTHRLQ